MQLVIVGQGQQLVVVGVVYLFQVCIGQQVGGGIVQVFQQGVLYYLVFDDMVEYFGVYVGGVEVDLFGVGVILYLYFVIGFGVVCDDVVLGMQVLENLLVGFGQCVDLWFVGCFWFEWCYVE